MQRLGKALNFTRNFFFTQIYRYTVLNKLTGWGYRPMKLQKVAAGARAFSLPPFLEKALESRLWLCVIYVYYAEEARGTERVLTAICYVMTTRK